MGLGRVKVGLCYIRLCLPGHGQLGLTGVGEKDNMLNMDGIDSTQFTGNVLHTVPVPAISMAING